MHGLVNRSIQCFLRDTYGSALWAEVAEAAGLGFDDFEALLAYDDELTDRALLAAADRLERSVDALLEDLGTYLISNGISDGLRRLLRFGGACFVDFLYSLDEIEDRARLAVPELDIPSVAITDAGARQIILQFRPHHAGFGAVLLGILRAMADDYGALVLLERRYFPEGDEQISVELLDVSFAPGREFALNSPAA